MPTGSGIGFCQAIILGEVGESARGRAVPTVSLCIPCADLHPCVLDIGCDGPFLHLVSLCEESFLILFFSNRHFIHNGSVVN